MTGVHLLEVLLLTGVADSIRNLRVVLLVEQVVEVAIVGARAGSGHHWVLLLFRAGRARLRASRGLLVLSWLLLELRLEHLVWVEERIEMGLVGGQVEVHAGPLVLEVIHGELDGVGEGHLAMAGVRSVLVPVLNRLDVAEWVVAGREVPVVVRVRHVVGSLLGLEAVAWTEEALNERVVVIVVGGLDLLRVNHLVASVVELVGQAALIGVQDSLGLVGPVHRDSLLEVEVDLLIIVGLARAGISWHSSGLVSHLLLLLEWLVLRLDHLVGAELLGLGIALLAARAGRERCADGAWVLEHILLGIAALRVSLDSLLGLGRGLQILPVNELLLVDVRLKLEGLRAGLGLGRACTFVLGLLVIGEADNWCAWH